MKVHLYCFLMCLLVEGTIAVLHSWCGSRECEKRCKQDPLAPAQYKRCPMWDCYAYKGCPHGGLYDLKKEKEPPQ